MTFIYSKILLFSTITIVLSCTQVKKETPLVSEPIKVTIGKQIKHRVVMQFHNPSFEDEPQPSHTPFGWDNCGFSDESPPDTAPIDNFKVTQRAFHGKTYLGLVTRDIRTWEVVGQKLKKTIEKDSCYTFSICLMRSPVYESRSQATGKMVNYNKPIVLRVWGGNTVCSRGEVLAESPKIDNEMWKKYIFTIKPSKAVNYLVFEAFYETGTEVPYNGNILLDNLSELTSCDSTEMPSR